MRKALLTVGVVVIALISFSGIASSGVYMQYWETMNSKGWIYYGELVPDYDFYGKYNYVDHMVWKEFDGEIYVPTHENWHINWDTKSLYKGKPCLITHYNFIYQLDYTPTKYKHFAMGYLHIVDPAASEWEPQWRLWLWDLMPIVTKFMDQTGDPPYGPPVGGKYPTIEDTTTLIDFIFSNFDITLIPLIDRLDLYDRDGNVLSIYVSIVR